MLLGSRTATNKQTNPKQENFNLQDIYWLFPPLTGLLIAIESGTTLLGTLSDKWFGTVILAKG